MQSSLAAYWPHKELKGEESLAMEERLKEARLIAMMEGSLRLNSLRLNYPGGMTCCFRARVLVSVSKK